MKAKSFWKDKGIKCPKCKTLNMTYFIKIHKECGKCGFKFKEEDLKKIEKDGLK
jgi:Zn ribbon nucleic-acid-binding protein